MAYSSDLDLNAKEEGYVTDKTGIAPLMERASSLIGRIGGGLLGADSFVESFKSLEQRDRLSAMLPYRIYDPQTMLFHNRASTGWVVELAPIANGDESFISLLKEWATEDAMTRGVVQFLNWSSPRVAPIIEEWARPRDARGGVYRAIAKARSELLERAAWTSLTNASPFLVREWRAFIALSFPGKPSSADIFELQALRDKLEGTLDTARVGHARIDGAGLISLMDDILNPRRGAWASDTSFDANRMIDVQCVRDDTEYQVGSSGLGVRTETLNPRTLEVECANFEWRMFQIRSYPQLISSWTAPLLIGHPTTDTLRHSGSVLSCMTLSFGGADLTNSYASTKLASSVRSAEGPMSKIDPSLSEKAGDWREVVSELQSGDRLVRAAHTVGVVAPSEEIEKADRSVRSIYKNLGLDIAKGSRIQRPLLSACMPMNGGDGAIKDLKTLQLTRRMVAQTAIALAPLHGEPRGSNEPVLLMVGRRGQPWMWSPFQNVGEGNHNVGIFGASGSGKSVLLQEFASAHAATGDIVVVLDDGYSFAQSARLQGGKCVTFSTEKKVSLNPFSLFGEELDSDGVRDAKVGITGFMLEAAFQGETPNPAERGLMMETVTAVWDEHGAAGSPDNVVERLKKAGQRGKDMAQALAPFLTDGAYGDFFARPASIKIDNPFTVYELSELGTDKQLRRLVIYCLLLLVDATMRSNRSQRKVLMMDEAWQILGDGEAAGFIEGFARRCRKYNAALITATQSIEDVNKSEGAKLAFQNSDWTIFMRMKDDAVEQLRAASLVELDPGLEAAIKSLKTVKGAFSEALVRGAGGFRCLGRLALDERSLVAYSSDPDVFAEFKRLAEMNVPIEDAVALIASKGTGS